MKPTVVAIVAGALVVAGAVTALMVAGRGPEWTTSSPAALAEFEKGIDAMQKVYRAEARDHFAKALQLDPNFVTAKLFLAGALDLPDTDPRKAALFDELRNADLTKLKARERFLISLAVAGHAKETTKAQEILKDYSAKNPDDPFALDALAGYAVGRQDWEEAQRIYSHLMEVAPNRVNAYNELGYLAMAQARFTDAEKMFQTYRYIAPDQANPHDSLGELLTLIGRYPEADKEFEEALRIKPDFCASYSHLVQLWQLSGSEDKAEEALARAKRANACSDYELKGLSCALAQWPHVAALDWEGAWQAASTACVSDNPGDNPLEFTSAVLTGRRAEAEALLGKVKAEIAKLSPAAAAKQQYQGIELHMEGVLLLADHKPVEAAERFLAADQKMSYRQLGPGLFKMFNGMYRVKALQQANNRDEAAKALDGLREINPRFVEQCARLMQVETGS